MNYRLNEVSTDAMNKTLEPIILAAVLLAAALPATGEDDAMLDTGMPFPAFELPAHDGSTVTGADLAGSPYLLFFYPKADTGG
jgi:cytochrome oxidase Cu insertion factor (SCO1/SenC/PrrC family)